MKAGPLSLVLVAYQCGPDMGSVSQIGWHWFVHLVRKGHVVTLVTHVRNRPAIESALDSMPDLRPQSQVIYIDTEWLAGPLYRLARRLFPRSEHGVFMVSQLDYFAFDFAAVRSLREMMHGGKKWDLVHIVTPVTTSAPSRLHKLGLPVVRGPLNCGLPVPSGFASVMKQDSMHLAKLRVLPKLLDQLLGSLRSCSAILVATRATLAAIPESARSKCVPMLENAIDPGCFQPGQAPLPPGQGQPLRLTFVGRLVPVKALPLLLKAMAMVKAEGYEVVLDVAGDGPMRAQWTREAASLGLEGDVQWLGAVAHDQVSRVMARGHLFCLPSVRESGGAVLLEAMACERAVLALNFGGPAEIVDSEVGWLIPAANEQTAVAGMVEALKEAFSHPQALREKACAGRRRVEALHTWDARVKLAESAYQQAMHAHARELIKGLPQQGLGQS